ncbi:MAG: glycosyltransferase family 9 protein [Lentisphaeria bacterium]|nr:glycosyltransferase family 9 protein [Lentisphaeria bacterium]
MRRLAAVLTRWRGRAAPGMDLTSRPPKRVLVVSEADGLGDAILLRRLLEPLSKVAEVRVVARRYHAPLYAEYLPSACYRAGDDRYFGFVPAGWLREADCLILHGQSVRGSLLCARWSRRVPTLGILFGGGFGAGHHFAEKDFPQVLAVYRAAAACLGIPLAERFAPAPPRDRPGGVVIHLGSNSPCKNWCFAHFVELHHMLDTAGVPHVFLAGRGDMAFLRRSPKWGEIEVACPGSYTEFRDRIRTARLVVCHNTSVLHLAAAYGIPTVSINHPYDYRWWHPYRDGRHHLAFTVPEGTTTDLAEKWDVLVKNRELAGNRRFDPIRPDQIHRAIMQLLAETPPSENP